MNDQPAPDDTVPPTRRRRRAAWWLGGVLLLAVLLMAAGGGLWWAARSEAGSAWVLRHVPGLQVSGSRGTLWGDFEAARVEFALPGGGRLVMTDLGWRGLHIVHAPWALLRGRVMMDELHAGRVDVIAGTSQADTQAPPSPPASLRLPVGLDIERLHIGELHAAALGDKPLRALHARVHLGAERGNLHRIDDISLAWDRLTAGGAARIATTAPFALDARLALAQSGSDPLPAWNAEVHLSGPLAAPTLQASLRAPASGTHAEQSLDLHAGLRPFDAWPLGDVQAATRALDLSALLSSAPVTALTGDAHVQTRGRNQPATATIALRNTQAGRWNEGRLPLRSLALDLRARPDDPRTLDLHTLDAELGTQQDAAGRLQGQGHWTPQQWTLDATLARLQPALLDARAPTMVLSGPLSLLGRGFDGGLATANLDVKANIGGRFSGAGAAHAAQLELDASASMQRIELRKARVQADGASASLAGTATHDGADAPWQLKARAALVDFDPAPWWPGRESSPLRHGPNRLNAKADVDIAWPMAAGPLAPLDRLAALRGHAHAGIERSVLAGVPITAEATLRNAGGTAALALQLDAGGNRVDAGGRLSAPGPAASRQGAGDTWDIRVAAPTLKTLAGLWQPATARPREEPLSGAVTATAHVEGRWPQIAVSGELDADSVRVGQTSVQRARAHWQFDSRGDAAIDVQGSATQLAFSPALFKGVPPISSATLRLTGSLRNHTLDLRADTKALPPAWTDALTMQQAAAPASAASSTLPSASSPEASSTPATAGAHTLAVLVAQGGATGTPARGRSALAWTGWHGSIRQLELRSSDPRAAALLHTQNVALDVQWAGDAMHLDVQPGRAQLLGAALRWERISWQAAAGGRPARIDAQAELEPLTVAPLLARLQPTFGWGGDLAVLGHVNIHSAPTFTADVVLERQRGDLTVTDETGITQSLGLTDLRIGLDVHDGVWSFTQGLAGKTLGVAAGAIVARTSPQATWPAPDTPIEGVLEVQVADLGTWGTWVPAGWRLAGALSTSASIGGRFGAPEYTGEIRGSGIGVRNVLEGVNVTDGELAIALQGATARIERFTAKAGRGSVALEGNATLGAAPKALLKLQADRFRVLGRVDRRIIASGQAQLQLDSDTLALDGKFTVDRGLIDFTRSDAPRLSDDVVVVRGPPADTATRTGATANPAPGRTLKLDLQVDLGERLRLRGHGLDTHLRGELHITSPGNRLSVAGTVSTDKGTYAAYGQKLTIDRGLITFSGPVDNPRLDIEATRPDTDVRVGVQVTGTALNPRVRLFSEPEMSDTDKLSWLVLGRASDGLGGTETALLQRAALALLAGEGEGTGASLTKAIGLDELSLSQSDGEVRETVISLGKQISSRWYVGYERSLNATAGSWQVIYRIARRFTLRAQTGAESSLDLIWTWRWQ
jgi:translocation and assembly module TamB